MADYVWTGARGDGLFSDAGNWDDLTTGQNPAPAPPGTLDTVMINRAGTITGTGAVTTLDLMRATGTLDLGAALNGTFENPTGNVALLCRGTLTATGTIDLYGTATVTVESGAV